MVTNYIQEISGSFTAKVFHWDSKWNRMERFCCLLSITFVFYIKS